VFEAHLHFSSKRKFQPKLTLKKRLTSYQNLKLVIDNFQNNSIPQIFLFGKIGIPTNSKGELSRAAWSLSVMVLFGLGLWGLFYYPSPLPGLF
jgi:hypothetical protein